MWIAVSLLTLLCLCTTLSCKPTLTVDEFFTYREFSSLILPTDDTASILIQTKHRIWDRNVNEEHLHLYNLTSNERRLITAQGSSFRPQWKGKFIALILSNVSTESRYIHLYSIDAEQLTPLFIGKETIHAFTWSTTSMSLYVATRTPRSNETEEDYEKEWKDVIEYREQYRGDTIYRIDLENLAVAKPIPLANVSHRVGELICSPNGQQLLFSSQPVSSTMERIEDYELFSVDLTKPFPSTPTRLTNNSAMERNLQWSTDGTIFFTVNSAGSVEGEYEDSQGRLYNFNPTTRKMDRWAATFPGDINSYALLEGGRNGVVMLGQRNIEIRVYTQRSSQAELIEQTGWNGSYQSLLANWNGNNSTIAFIHSSFQRPQEVYFTHHIDQLQTAKAITNENHFFTERDLPQGKAYRWFNKDDGSEIEGILLYPPGKYEQTNLPLYVLIHGGPYSGDLNSFRPNWYYCGSIMATEGWLVFQPNYRGSIGYGDQFMRGVRLQTLSRPAKDILDGVDALVRDGIADGNRLTIGGYSYGAFLTNWIVTQTTRFNAALSGAGGVEHVADWGLTDIPLSNFYLFNGFPWQVPQRYQAEAPIFQIDKVRTPMHIVVPANDIRVPASGNFLLERALHALRVPSKLIVLPNEGHALGYNPWHEKIKVREELRWLKLYGNSSVFSFNHTVNSVSRHQAWYFDTFVFSCLVLLMYLKTP